MKYDNPTPTRAQPLAYSVAEACRISSLGRTSIFKLIKEGRLESRRIGSRTLILAGSLRNLIEGDKAPGRKDGANG